MMVCDYNGWNDAPEEEREALDLVESTLTPPPLTVGTGAQPRNSSAPADARLHRRAA
jgi:hypothetical protein